MEDVSKYIFSPRFSKCSAGNFKEKVKQRYPKISKKELDAIVDREYGKEPEFIEVEEPEEKKDGDSGSVKGKAGASKG
mgnify:CR=1 FL=1